MPQRPCARRRRRLRTRLLAATHEKEERAAERARVAAEEKEERARWTLHSVPRFVQRAAQAEAIAAEKRVKLQKRVRSTLCNALRLMMAARSCGSSSAGAALGRLVTVRSLGCRISRHVGGRVRPSKRAGLAFICDIPDLSCFVQRRAPSDPGRRGCVERAARFSSKPDLQTGHESEQAICWVAPSGVEPPQLLRLLPRKSPAAQMKLCSPAAAAAPSEYAFLDADAQAHLASLSAASRQVAAVTVGSAAQLSKRFDESRWLLLENARSSTRWPHSGAQRSRRGTGSRRSLLCAQSLLLLPSDDGPWSSSAPSCCSDLNRHKNETAVRGGAPYPALVAMERRSISSGNRQAAEASARCGAPSTSALAEKSLSSCTR